MILYSCILKNLQENNSDPNQIGPEFMLTLIPATFFFLKMLSAFYVSAHIQVHFKLDSFMEANIMNPDQTVPKQSILSPYCLQYRLHKKHTQTREQVT